MNKKNFQRLLVTVAVSSALMVSGIAEAKGGRGFGGFRSMFRSPSKATSVAPRTAAAPKPTPATPMSPAPKTVERSTIIRNESSSEGLGSSIVGGAVGTMAGMYAYDALTNPEEKKEEKSMPAPETK